LVIHWKNIGKWPDSIVLPRMVCTKIPKKKKQEKSIPMVYSVFENNICTI